MSTQKDEDKKYETIGRTICSISYLVYALKIVALISVIALVVLYFLHKPLWLAPVIGFVMFWIYRSIRRMIISGIIRFSRKMSGTDEK